MATKKRQTTPYLIRFTEAEMVKVREAADADGTTIAELIRRAVKADVLDAGNIAKRKQAIEAMNE